MKYQEAIDALKPALDDKFVQNDFELQLMIHDWLHKSFDQLKNSDSSQYHLKLREQAEDSVKHYAFAERIHAIDAQYDLTKKEEEIDSLEDLNKGLQNKLWTVIPILGGVLILGFILFYLFKIYKKKSSILEAEQSETLQKLDELKQIVVKNHIVLKDKTKVYISDLMYIKSDDHYLEIMTQDDKKHTVRGKLSQIKEELPPNFIQCHRSYIVNSNFIKQIQSNSLTLINKSQIPLSRSYKDKFKD